MTIEIDGLSIIILYMFLFLWILLSKVMSWSEHNRDVPGCEILTEWNIFLVILLVIEQVNKSTNSELKLVKSLPACIVIFELINVELMIKLNKINTKIVWIINSFRKQLLFTHNSLFTNLSHELLFSLYILKHFDDWVVLQFNVIKWLIMSKNEETFCRACKKTFGYYMNHVKTKEIFEWQLLVH